MSISSEESHSCIRSSDVQVVTVKGPWLTNEQVWRASWTIDGRFGRSAESYPFDEDHQTQVDEDEGHEDDLWNELADDVESSAKEP